MLIFEKLRGHGFARTTAVLDQLGLTVVDARITPTGDGFSLDLYHVLEDDGAPITDAERQSEIERALWRSVQRPDDSPFAVSRRTPRQVRMFNTLTHITLSVDERNQRSVLELIAGDRPGLLCDVGKVLMQEHIELHAAKIMTVGERAEDVFYITDIDNQPLHDAAASALPEGPAHWGSQSAPRGMNPRLARLHAYPFERLARLKASVQPPAGAAPYRDVDWRAAARPPAGGPGSARTQSPPSRQLSGHRRHAHALRAAAAQWLERRFAAGAPRRSIRDTMVLPVNGTREEGLVRIRAGGRSILSGDDPLVAMPNPFYQIYEGAAAPGRSRAVLSSMRPQPRATCRTLRVGA